MPGAPGAGHDDAWLLLALAALLAVVGATASSAARRRLRNGGRFIVGFAVGAASLSGGIGVVWLAFAGPEPIQHGWQALRSWSESPQLPNIVYPSRPAITGTHPGTPPTEAPLVGRVTRVRDGDTIVVERTPIRFADIDCAESGTPAGDRATEAMRRLAAGQQVRCQLAGRRSYDREIGSCSLLDGRDLGMTMVTQGLCAVRR